MESMTRNHEQVETLVEVLPDISEAMGRAEDWLVCHDQERELMEAVEDVVNRARRELSKEYLAAQVRSERFFQQELMGLVAHVAKAILGSQVPTHLDQIPEPAGMGKVLIAVGPDGIPVDLSMVNVSELAHRTGLAEGSVENVINEKGYVLFTLRAFQEFPA